MRREKNTETSEATRARLRMLITLALFAAIAYVSTALIRIPVVNPGFTLSYDPKDIVIVIAGFIYGPIPAVGIVIVDAFLEMITFSETGFWGFLMNVIASISFTLPAVLIYKHKRTFKGAVFGLLSGVSLAVVMMLLWNLIVTPIYTGAPRSVVAGMLPTVFLPFNLLKCSINALFAIILYKPISKALRAAKILPEPSAAPGKQKMLIPVVAGILLAIVIALTVLYSLLYPVYAAA